MFLKSQAYFRCSGKGRCLSKFLEKLKIKSVILCKAFAKSKNSQQSVNPCSLAQTLILCACMYIYPDPSRSLGNSKDSDQPVWLQSVLFPNDI